MKEKKPLFSSHDVKVYDRKGSFTNILRSIDVDFLFPAAVKILDLDMLVQSSG